MSKFAVYVNDDENDHPEVRIVCERFEDAKRAVDRMVLEDETGVPHAWKGTVYPLGTEAQEGSPFPASDLSQCLYQQRRTR